MKRTIRITITGIAHARTALDYSNKIQNELTKLRIFREEVDRTAGIRKRLVGMGCA